MGNEILEALPSMSIQELWNTFKMAFEEELIGDTEFEPAKTGFKIRFNILYYLKTLAGEINSIVIDDKNYRVEVLGKYVRLIDFYEEMDKREAYMRSLLRRVYSDIDPVEGR